jgi:hypothetical protein
LKASSEALEMNPLASSRHSGGSLSVCRFFCRVN